MSLPDLVGGSAQCGPVNPLQQLGKRFGQDRGTQFDSLQPGPEAVAGRPSTFRTQRAPLSEDPAFFSAEPVAPFQVDQLRQALPNVHPHAAWAPNASHSHMAGPSSASAPMTSATASTTAPAWAQDFMQATRSSGKARTGASHFNVQPQRPMAQFPHRPFHAHAMPMMTATRPMRPAHTEPDAIASVSRTYSLHLRLLESSWDSAFTAVDAQHATEAMPTEAQLDTMNADELAATAERLLHAVRNDTSEKFQQSEFLGLMRKLRDREAEVRGADIVDANAKGKAKAEGPPTQAYLDEMLRDATSNAGPTTTGHAQTMQHDALADLQEFWQEEDAAKQTRASATHPTFMGDSGDVAARMREDEALLSSKPSVEVPQDDDFIAKEYNKWTSMGANVSGATQAWEETIENEDFVGRAWQGQQGRGQRGAQHAEWDKLQADWDEFEATTDGIYPTVADRIQQPFPYEAPQYVFHDANPYMANMTRQHLSHTSPSMLDNVLEQEAAVQADPTDASRWYSLGLRQQENEREKQAIAALRKALDIDPKLKDAWLALAVSYTNENDRDEALEALERWVNINDTYRGVVHAYLRSRDQSSNRHRRLANVLMAMARSGVPDTGEPIDADIQMALGVLFNASGEYDKAVDCFRAALSVRPDDWILYNRIGATLSNSGRSQESLEYYQQALNLRPDFARCHFNVSISCLNLKVCMKYN